MGDWATQRENDLLTIDMHRYKAALEWIREIADKNLEQDEKLRTNGARTLKRIADKCDEALK